MSNRVSPEKRNMYIAWAVACLSMVSFIGLCVAHFGYVHYDVPEIIQKAREECAVPSCPVKKMDCTVYINEMESWMKKHYTIEDQLSYCVKDLIRCQNESHIGCMSMEPHCE